MLFRHHQSKPGTDITRMRAPGFPCQHRAEKPKRGTVNARRRFSRYYRGEQDGISASWMSLPSEGSRIAGIAFTATCSSLKSLCASIKRLNFTILKGTFLEYARDAQRKFRFIRADGLAAALDELSALAPPFTAAFHDCRHARRRFSFHGISAVTQTRDIPVLDCILSFIAAKFS